MAMPSLPRTTLERAVERMIDRLDAIDGDADNEPYGDELDTADTEDEELSAYALEHCGAGPGCALSDPDMGDHEVMFDRPGWYPDGPPLRLVPPT